MGLPELAARLDEAAHWAQPLSPGEQQRIAFARALVQKPDWLFLDEATSAVDEETEATLYGLLRRAPAGHHRGQRGPPQHAARVPRAPAHGHTERDGAGDRRGGGRRRLRGKMAEGEGFEPPIPCGIPVFKTGAFNRARPPLRV